MKRRSCGSWGLKIRTRHLDIAGEHALIATVLPFGTKITRALRPSLPGQATIDALGFVTHLPQVR